MATAWHTHISNLLKHDKPLLFQVVEQRYRKMLTTVTQSHQTGPRGGQLLQLESQHQRTSCIKNTATPVNAKVALMSRRVYCWVYISRKTYLPNNNPPSIDCLKAILSDASTPVLSQTTDIYFPSKCFFLAVLKQVLHQTNTRILCKPESSLQQSPKRHRKGRF